MTAEKSFHLPDQAFTLTFAKACIPPWALADLNKAPYQPAPAAGVGVPTSSSPPRPAQGGNPSSKKLPVGSRRVWHNRIVEKLPDQNWHVVGHIAGLEVQKKPPLLDTSGMDPQHLQHLITQIRGLEAKERAAGGVGHQPSKP
jgi:hypothetical protein